MTQQFIIHKTSGEGMTTYRVAGMEQADNTAICQALTEAAKDVWQYMTVANPGTYDAAGLTGKKAGCILMKDDTELPLELHTLQVECGSFNMCVKPIDDRGVSNYYTIFTVLNQFEKLARVKQTDRAVFTVGRQLGELVCEARVILPTNMKAICDCCGDDPLRPSMSYPALDLDRQCIVATDVALLVTKKVTVAHIHYEGKVPETFYLPKEVARMQGEVTVQLYERGCTVTDTNGVEASVEHEAPYPKWHTVWPQYRGGMTIVDSKAWTKVVKSAVNGLPQKGKWKDEVLLLNHYGASDALFVRGYEGAEMRNEQRIGDCIATDEVPWRLTVNAPRLLKALALQPKLMWAGYGEMSTLPDRLVMEDMQEQIAVMLYHYCVDDLLDALRETEAGYAVGDSRQLQRCYEQDGWLLEQVETKYPTCGGVKVEGLEVGVERESNPNPELPKSAPKKSHGKNGNNGKATAAKVSAISAISAGQPTLADQLRARLAVLLAA